MTEVKLHALGPPMWHPFEVIPVTCNGEEHHVTIYVSTEGAGLASAAVVFADPSTKASDAPLANAKSTRCIADYHDPDEFRSEAAMVGLGSTAVPCVRVVLAFRRRLHERRGDKRPARLKAAINEAKAVASVLNLGLDPEDTYHW